MKILVAYFSRTGNTKFVAEKIAEQMKAELSEITDRKKRKGILTYLMGGFASFRKRLTEIEVTKPIEDYDLIIVGSPVWAGKITPAIRTFLVRNDFSNKQVAYFITLDGDKPEKTLKNMKETITPKTCVGELAIMKAKEKPEETEEKVKKWCNQINKNI